MSTSIIQRVCLGVLFLSSLSGHIWAQEQLGKIRIHDFMLEPYVSVRELGEGSEQDTGFRLGHSFFGVRWEKSETLSAILKVGDLAMIHPATKFVLNSTTGFGFFEGYVQALTDYGQVRMGLIPTGFGYEGHQTESLLRFPRSKIFSEGFVGIRDFGASYYVRHRAHYTQFAIHNGESTEINSDSRYWYTARWGWRNRNNIHLGLTGVTGHFLDKATKVDTRMRIGNVFAAFPFWAAFLVLEANYGDSVIGDQEPEEFVGGHLDIIKAVTRDIDVLFRYDAFEPSSVAENDVEVAYTLGLAWSDRHKNSIFHLWVVKNLEEESHEIPNDEIRISWRLTSSILDL